MAHKKLGWIIQSNNLKFVSKAEPDHKKVFKFNWTEDAKKAKIFEKYPEKCPANSHVFQVILKPFYKIQTKENFKIQLIKTEEKTFNSIEEHHKPYYAIESFENEQREKKQLLLQQIEEIDFQLSQCKNFKISLEEDVQFKLLAKSCCDKKVAFSIPLWGKRYNSVQGSCELIGDQIALCDKRKNILVKIDQHTIGDFTTIVDSKVFSFDVWPRNDYFFIVTIELT